MPRRVTRQRGQGGAAAVEFALISIPLILLLLGTLQFAWYFYAAQSASAAAREGARRVVVGECWDSTAFLTFVKNQSPMVTAASYSPAALTAADIGDVVTVTVAADAGIINLFPLPGGGQVDRQFDARLEDKSPGDGSCS